MRNRCPQQRKLPLILPPRPTPRLCWQAEPRVELVNGLRILGKLPGYDCERCVGSDVVPWQWFCPGDLLEVTETRGAAPRKVVSHIRLAAFWLCQEERPDRPFLPPNSLLAESPQRRPPRNERSDWD